MQILYTVSPISFLLGHSSVSFVFYNEGRNSTSDTIRRNEERFMEGSKQERMLEIFFRGLRGEDISIQKLAVQYGVSTKSISRTLNDIKAFLADHHDFVGNTES